MTTLNVTLAEQIQAAEREAAMGRMKIDEARKQLARKLAICENLRFPL